MPDDYPATAWSQELAADGLDDYQSMLERYELADDRMPNPTLKKLLERYGRILPEQAEKSIKIDEKLERRRISELIGSISEGDLISLLMMHFRKGNRKVPEQYLIWNMTPAHQCPSLGFTRGRPDPGKSTCQAFDGDGKLVCYAWRDEITYPDAFPARVRQNELWERVVKTHGGTELFVAAIRRLHKGGQRSGGIPVVGLRISEAGDFPDQKSVDIVNRVTREVADLAVPEHIQIKIYREEPAVTRTGHKTKKMVLDCRLNFRWVPRRWVTYCYTARQGLDFSEAEDSGLIVLGSDWGVEEPGIAGQFKMVNDKGEPPLDWAFCPMKCRICQRCVLGRSSRVLNHKDTKGDKQAISYCQKFAAIRAKNPRGGQVLDPIT